MYQTTFATPCEGSIFSTLVAQSTIILIPGDPLQAHPSNFGL